MAGNFGGKIFWRIAENMSFGGIYFGGIWLPFCILARNVNVWDIQLDPALDKTHR